MLSGNNSILLQVLCTPAAAAAASKPAAAKAQNGDTAAAAAAAAKSSQTYLIATKELRIEAAGTSAGKCFLSNCFPEQGGVVGMPVGMQITACDAQVRTFLTLSTWQYYCAEFWAVRLVFWLHRVACFVVVFVVYQSGSGTCWWFVCMLWL